MSILRIVSRHDSLDGPVNLPSGGRAATGRFALALRGDAQIGDLAPRDDRLGTKRSIVG
jgi:hypothetical protein